MGISRRQLLRHGAARMRSHPAEEVFMRWVLIISELALAVVLVVGAGLLLRTFWSVLKENPGFNPSGVVTASFWLSHPNDPGNDAYPDARVQTIFIREVLQPYSTTPRDTSGRDDHEFACYH